MNMSLIVRTVVTVLLACTACLGQGARPANPENRNDLKLSGEYASMITSAIADEMVVNTSLQSARSYGVESAGRVSIHLNVLVAPFTPDAQGFSTHVLYLVPGYGYVMREVSVYPRQKLALFWLGYSPQGPGTDTGFNCTHSHSNCKIEDLPFRDLKNAFSTWMLATPTILIGDPDLSRDAKERNAQRSRLIEAGE